MQLQQNTAKDAYTIPSPITSSLSPPSHNILNILFMILNQKTLSIGRDTREKLLLNFIGENLMKYH